VGREISDQKIIIPKEFDFGSEFLEHKKIYRLVAIVLHCGPTMDAGHYICYGVRRIKN
jgi:uncharacterized UBP type Zn finger protein